MEILAAGVAVHLVGALLWWLRLHWQLRIDRQRGENVVQFVTGLRGAGGHLREQRADGSVTELMVGADDGS
jgi:hypothetical protein